MFSYKKMTYASVMLAAAAGIAHGAIVVNEIDYDQPSTDTTEFIELYNPDATVQLLVGFTLVLFNESGTTAPSYTTLALTGAIQPGGYYVISDTALAGSNQNFAAASDAIQNGSPDGLGIYLGAFTTPAAATATNLVPGTGISYEGTNTSVPAEFTVIPLTLADTGVGTVSLSRLPNGTGDFALTGTTTPGAANVFSPVPEPTSLAALAAGGLFLRRRRAR